MNKTQLQQIIREEIKSTLGEQERMFKIDLNLSDEIYDLLRGKLGEAFVNEFPRKTDLFFFLDKNLK